jgi:prepilin-type N-terminal cleavage/methylation domain-containing protein
VFVIKTNKSRGFSLVEVIVAICILAVLMSVLVPSYIRMMSDSRMKKDETKFESICTAFKRSLGEPEVQNEVSEFYAEDEEDEEKKKLIVVFKIGKDGVILFGDGEIEGDLKTMPMQNSVLWLNSYQSVTTRYEVEYRENWNKYLVFTLTPKTPTTTADCKYALMDSWP